MSALQSPYRRCFFQAVTLVCIVVLLLQLVVLSIEAKNIHKVRHRSNNQRRVGGGGGEYRLQNYDSPRLTQFPIHDKDKSSRSQQHHNNRGGGGNHMGHFQSHSSVSHPSHLVEERRPSRGSNKVPLNNSVLGSTDNDLDEQEFSAKREYRIRQIMDHILKQLNLKTPPNVTGIVETSNPTIKKLKAEVTERNNNMPHGQQHPIYQSDMPMELNNRQFFIPVEERYPFNYKIPNGTDIMYFKMNHDDVSSGELVNAVLHLWVKPVEVSFESKLLVEVYKVNQPVNENDLVREMISSCHHESIESNRGQWTSFPVFQLVSEWTTNPDTNFGMVVKMEDHLHNQVVVTNSYEMPEKAPLLEVQFSQGSGANRITRSSEGSKCSSEDTKCCRIPLSINFTEHSFDFIVAPKVYMANFCNGKCPYLYAHRYVHQAVVQKLQNATATYGPCCGAKELIPLNMLYYDHDGKIRLDTINDMVIEKCSCD